METLYCPKLVKMKPFEASCTVFELSESFSNNSG